jgi:protein-arginine kinase activator protein McsA
MKMTKREQIDKLISIMKMNVEREEYFSAANMRDLIVEYQSKEFNLDNTGDLITYNKILFTFFR